MKDYIDIDPESAFTSKIMHGMKLGLAGRGNGEVMTGAPQDYTISPMPPDSGVWKNEQGESIKFIDPDILMKAYVIAKDAGQKEVASKYESFLRRPSLLRVGGGLAVGIGLGALLDHYLANNKNRVQPSSGA